MLMPLISQPSGRDALKLPETIYDRAQGHVLFKPKVDKKK